MQHLAADSRNGFTCYLSSGISEVGNLREILPSRGAHEGLLEAASGKGNVKGGFIYHQRERESAGEEMASSTEVFTGGSPGPRRSHHLRGGGKKLVSESGGRGGGGGDGFLLGHLNKFGIYGGLSHWFGGEQRENCQHAQVPEVWGHKSIFGGK